MNVSKYDMNAVFLSSSFLNDKHILQQNNYICSCATLHTIWVIVIKASSAVQVYSVS